MAYLALLLQGNAKYGLTLVKSRPGHPNVSYHIER
jgi:hypothetical protein